MNLTFSLLFAMVVAIAPFAQPVLPSSQATATSSAAELAN